MPAVRRKSISLVHSRRKPFFEVDAPALKTPERIKKGSVGHRINTSIQHGKSKASSVFRRDAPRTGRRPALSSLPRVRTTKNERARGLSFLQITRARRTSRRVPRRIAGCTAGNTPGYTAGTTPCAAASTPGATKIHEQNWIPHSSYEDEPPVAPQRRWAHCRVSADRSADVSKIK